jgi:hypothetical protein
MAFHFNSNFTMLASAAGSTAETLAIGKQSLSVILQALQPGMTGELLLNLTEVTELDTVDITCAAFPPASYTRLVALKNRYDPENLLRFNQNIPPSSKV